MFCGSCMHDNTWARALQAREAEVSLIPTYTPIRVDEQNLSEHSVFLGGINVYLEHRLRVWQTIPRVLTRWLDRPWVINLATRIGVSNDAGQLGALTLAMLSGEAGPQRREVDELAQHLTQGLKPDVICFSNILLVGAVRRLRERFAGPLYCVLQGDDVFLEDLSEPYQSQALAMIRERSADFDGFIVHSVYYRDFMSTYLGLPIEKFHIIPLGIDMSGHDGQPRSEANDDITIGYFARICEAKGLRQLFEAFKIVHRDIPTARLRVGGYLSKQDTPYYQGIARDARTLGDAFEYVGSPDTHAAKVNFLKSLDVLSVPTVYHEPKGLYVLEAWANGVPVVQPRHGSFPEMIEATGGGLLVEADSADELARGLKELITDGAQRYQLAQNGHAGVRRHYDSIKMADATLDIFRSALG